MRATADDEYFFLHDANFNVTAAVEDATGAPVVERYAYSPYGEVTFLDSNFANPSISSAIDNEHLYTGRRTDPETGLQLNRYRFYHQQLGRWVSWDPIGYWGRSTSLYEYTRSQPAHLVDPSGLRDPDEDRPWPTGPRPPVRPTSSEWDDYMDTGLYPPDRPSGDPQGGVPWWEHYWGGSGNPINIGDYGLLPDYQGDDDVQDAMDSYEDTITGSNPIDCCTGPSGRRFVTIWVERSYPVDLTETIYPRGNGRLEIFGYCTWCIDRSDGASGSNRTVKCKTMYRFVDYFDDPYDVFDVVPGSWNPNGTPYPITGGWSDEWGGTWNGR